MASGMVEAGSRGAGAEGSRHLHQGLDRLPSLPVLSSPQANHLVQPLLDTTTFTEWTISCLSSFPKAAVTNNHSLGGLKR